MLLNKDTEPNQTILVFWSVYRSYSVVYFKKGPEYFTRYYLPTPPLGQDMTQGQFLSGV